MVWLAQKVLVVAILLCITSIAPYCAGHELEINTNLQRPHELEIFHESSLTSACTYLTFRTTQTHNALKDFSDVYKINGNLVEGFNEHGTYEKSFSYDTSLLWDIATSSCGPPSTWKFPVYIASELKNTLSSFNNDGNENQKAFSLPEFQAPPRPAPIAEIVPIIQTGRPGNRIDFVFLGDGCEWFDLAYHDHDSHWYQFCSFIRSKTLLKSATSLYSMLESWRLIYPRIRPLRP